MPADKGGLKPSKRIKMRNWGCKKWLAGCIVWFFACLILTFGCWASSQLVERVLTAQVERINEIEDLSQEEVEQRQEPLVRQLRTMVMSFGIPGIILVCGFTMIWPTILVIFVIRRWRGNGQVSS